MRSYSRSGLLRYKIAPKCLLPGPFGHFGVGGNPGVAGTVRSYNLVFTYPCQVPLGEGQGEGVSTQTDLPQLLPLQGELSHTSALSPRERENEKALGTRNCSDWGRYGLGEDGIESMVRVASLQTPGAEQGSHDALGLAARCGAGTAADLAAHHRRTKAPLRRVVVRSRSWLNYEGE